MEMLLRVMENYNIICMQNESESDVYNMSVFSIVLYYFEVLVSG